MDIVGKPCTLQVSYDVIRENTHLKTFHKQIDKLKELSQHSGELGQLAHQLNRQ